MEKMIIKMTLLSDTIFGNGGSIPGAEDIAVLCDSYGFPYYKGGTFKGIFREELYRYLELCGKKDDEIQEKVYQLLGRSSADEGPEQMVFSDFVIAGSVKKQILEEVKDPGMVTEMLTNVRTFTKIEDNGMVARGSLRSARCVDKGISFYSEILYPEGEKELVNDILGLIKWVGSMRNRGFGKISITEI